LSHEESFRTEELDDPLELDPDGPLEAEREAEDRPHPRT